MLYFNNDYNETCHPAVLDRIRDFSARQMPGYGTDDCCEKAANIIRCLCGNHKLAVHFLVGGTQTNLTVISAALRPHQAVIAAESGHINVHETGAIEATGHKVILVPSRNGKIRLEQIEGVVTSQSMSMDAEHIAQPKMVYISNPTEYGSTYNLSELEAIASYCKEHRLFLYLDGARMGYGLAAADNDITLADYARLCDAFYIGGTKVGAMFGEAVVIANPDIAEDFRYLMKQHGAMLAKGWLLGLQFQALFEDGLYVSISRHANQLADKIRSELQSLGYPLYVEGTTNQIFTILPNSLLSKLDEKFAYAVWETVDENHTVVRFCTSWSTKEENVDALCEALKNFK